MTEIELEMENDTELRIECEQIYIMDDYEQLKNKPRLNGTSYMWSLEQKIQQQQASLHPHRPSRAMRAGRVMLTITWKVKKSENGSTP